jgi:hypothetical protein
MERRYAPADGDADKGQRGRLLPAAVLAGPLEDGEPRQHVAIWLLLQGFWARKRGDATVLAP